MNSTKLIGKLFISRQKEIDLFGTQAEAIQEQVFRKLIHNATDHTAISNGFRYRTTKAPKAS